MGIQRDSGSNLAKLTVVNGGGLLLGRSLVRVARELLRRVPGDDRHNELPGLLRSKLPVLDF